MIERGSVAWQTGGLGYAPASLETADGHLDDRYGAFLEAAVLAAPMPDFGLSGDPYPALGSLLLHAEAARSLVRATERLGRVFARAVDGVMHDTNALRRMGFPAPFIEVLRREVLGTEPVLGRFDFVRDPTPWPGGDDATGAWRAVEYNADTPSGLREMVSLDPLVRRTLRRTFGGAVVAVGTGVARRVAAAMVRAIPRSLPSGRTVSTLGIVVAPEHLEDTCQAVAMARVVAPTLARRGVNVVMGAPDDLRRRGTRATLCGAPIDALYRYYPVEAMPGTLAWEAIDVATAAGEVHVVNGMRGVVAQNKGMMAWVWSHRDNRDHFDDEARATIRTYVPPTTWVEAVPPAPVRPGLVVKQAFGREGAEVAMGADLDDAGWAACVRWGSYVAQARVPSAPLIAALPTAQGHVLTEAWPVVGGMAAGGRWVGAYGRLGGVITRHDARWCSVLSIRAGHRDVPVPDVSGA